MLFNSLEFLLFLPTVFAAYWILNLWTDRPRGLKAQNLLLLIASYVFYGWWDWRFLSLIAFSTLVDYAVGLQIAKANAREISPMQMNRHVVAPPSAGCGYRLWSTSGCLAISNTPISSSETGLRRGLPSESTWTPGA